MAKLHKDYDSAKELLKTKHREFREYEAMFMADVTEGEKHGFKTRVTDASLATIALERSARVMSQFPKGTVKALSRNDKGKSLLMGLVLERYIIPNSNWVHSHLQKLQMMDLYSLMYGSMYALVDWVDRPGYVGPDFTLIPIYNVTPQPGKVTIEDSDYIYVDSYHSKSWFKEQLKTKGAGWKKEALKKFISGGDEKKRKTEGSYNDKKNRYNETEDPMVTTKYTRKKWITFDPETGEVLRELDNPHENDELPVVAKHAFPLVDDFFGIGDFKRGASLQKAMDSITGLTLDGVKLDIFPPRIVNPNGVVQSSLSWGPGKTWLETLPNSIRFTERSAKNLNSFQTLITYMRGTLLNQNGTTDTSANSQGAFDPGFGKTPQALALLQQRESTRDNWDKRQMEMAIEKLYNKFIDLTLKRQKKPIEVQLFEGEIEQIENAGYDDVNEMLEKSSSGDIAFITVGKEDIEKTKYRFYIDADSTTQRDKQLEHEVWGEMLLTFSKLPGLAETLKSQGYEFNFAEAIRKWAASAGVDDFDAVIFPASKSDTNEEAPNPSNPAGVNGANEEAIMQQMMQQQQAQQNPQLGAQGAQLPPQQQFLDPNLVALAQQQFNQ